MQTLSVVCWGFDHRLDERGGWGFSVHPDEQSALIWMENMDIRRTVIGAGMNSLAVPYVCGHGFLDNPSREIFEKLGDGRGVFIRSDDFNQPGFRLTQGKTPDQVTSEFLDEKNRVPD
jgi:hypothetical protein